MDVKNLTNRQLAAQLIMVDIPGSAVTESLRENYQKNPWGGIILFAKNIIDEKQTQCLTQDILGLSQLPLFIGVDHEGGIVSRFAFDSTVPLCGNMALGAADNEEYARQSGLICAQQLKCLGINTNFAPVMDVNSNPHNPIIGARSFGEDPYRVAALGRAYIKGLKQGGILSCAKHFPGHGDVAKDSHSTMPTIVKTAEEMERCELIPFRSAADADMIMTAHINFPAIDESNLPATLSPKIIRTLLREKLNYDGAIITDSMFMDGIKNYYPYAQAARMALAAGVDMLMLCGSYALQIEALDTIEQALNEGLLSRNALERSLIRLLRLRYKLKANEPAQTIERPFEIMEKITEKTITLVKNENHILPLCPDHNILLLSPEKFPPSPQGETVMEPMLPQFLSQQANDVHTLTFNLKSENHDRQTIQMQAERADIIILCLYANGRLPDSQKKLCEIIKPYGEKTITISLSSPYIFSEVSWSSGHVACYNYGPLSMKALCGILLGKIQPCGKLPVSISQNRPIGFGITEV